MTRSICLRGRDCPELLGAGDLLRPWDIGTVGDSIEGPSSWRVLQPATLVVLDQRFAEIAGRWPSIMASLLARSALRSRALALHLAIAHIRQATRAC